ncbi:MAG TPA: BrxA family protein, partial [Chitinispirillaceae bacterium]|nr:BrxA family protein [Chitinispirillaceae bacterium]
MNGSLKYSFGFVAASLRLNETILIERTFREGGYTDYNNIDNKVDLIGHGNTRTCNRQYRELAERLRSLTSAEKDLLVGNDLTSRRQIAFLGVCKHYLFIREFVLEVLREKMLVYDYQLTESDYLSFERKKETLDLLADSTRHKIKQVVFKILEQAGIIDNVKSLKIQPQLPGQQVIDAVMED